MSNTINNPFSFIDLFAGAGGLSEGFIQAGFNPVAHIEMNADACNTLKTREAYYYLLNTDQIDIYYDYLKQKKTRDELYAVIPLSVLDRVINETMRKEGMPQLYKKIDALMSAEGIGAVDVIIGGPPCQAYSLVGRAVKGENIKNDPRNYLYELYLKVLKRYQPKLFVFENVPGLITAGEGSYFEDIRNKFKAAGYDIDYKIVNAIDFGVMQNRKRVILIGWLNNLNMTYPVFKNSKTDYCVMDLFKDLPPIQGGQSCDKYKPGKYSNYLRMTGIRKPGDVLTWHVARSNIDRDKEIYKKAITEWNNGRKRLKYTDLPKSLQTHNNMNSFLDRFKVVAGDLSAAQTMMAHISKDGHYFIHPDIDQSRSISVREAARIQSFPDDFYFEGSRTAAYTQIGNAVPPLMAKGIAEAIRDSLEETYNG